MTVPTNQMQQRAFNIQQPTQVQEPRLSQLLAQPRPILNNDQISLLNLNTSNIGAKQWNYPLSQPFPLQANLNTSLSNSLRDLSQTGRHPVRIGQTYSGQPELSLAAQKPADGSSVGQNHDQSY